MLERIHLCGTRTPSGGAAELYDLSVTDQEGRPAVLWEVTWHGERNVNRAEDVVYIPQEIYSYITPVVFGAWLKRTLLPVVSDLVDWGEVTDSDALDAWCTNIRDCTECR